MYVIKRTSKLGNEEFYAENKRGWAWLHKTTATDSKTNDADNIRVFRTKELAQNKLEWLINNTAQVNPDHGEVIKLIT